MRARRERDLVAWIKRNRLSIFFCCTVLVFMQGGFILARRHDPYVAGHVSSDHPNSHYAKNQGYSVASSHPIARHIHEAEELYAVKMKSQSRSLTAAVKEYRRRYKRDPPKGFDAWFAFASGHDVKMVDEYDGLVEDLAPFWKMSGEELRRRALQVGSLPGIDIVRIQDGKSSIFNAHPDKKDTEVGSRAVGFQAMLEKFAFLLPDMDFPINSHAEGRVLVPWEHQKYPNLTQEDSSVGLERVLGGPFQADWGDDGNVWETWRRTCPPDTNARRLFSAKRVEFSAQGHDYLHPHRASPQSDFRFLSSKWHPTSYPDFCNEPHEHYQQGHFFSDWRTIHALYPVFSVAKAQGFLDIKIPSHYYFGNTKRYTYGWNPINLQLEEDDRLEVPWVNKKDKVFWRGASTGGGNHPPGFSPHYHRHRFLRLASDKSDSNVSITIAHPHVQGHYLSAHVPAARINEEVIDAAFVKAVSAEAYPGGSEALVEAHRFGDPAILGEYWAYKYLVDLDGAGYSGRFMAFLASNSVPVKATVYDEFFRDWIQPWVHFIPLSPSYREIYNIHAYFSGPTDSTKEAHGRNIPASSVGDRQLRRIARAGKHWKKTIGRPIDMEVYVYRLCIEWARLWADDRDTMNFTL